VRGSWDDPQVQRLERSDKSSDRTRLVQGESQELPAPEAAVLPNTDSLDGLATGVNTQKKKNPIKTFFKKIIKTDDTSNDELLDNVGH